MVDELVLDGLSKARWAAFVRAAGPTCRRRSRPARWPWRYEIEARRPLRLRPDERAIAVPLGFRAMLLEPGMPVPLRLA